MKCRDGVNRIIEHSRDQQRQDASGMYAYLLIAKDGGVYNVGRWVKNMQVVAVVVRSPAEM